MSVESLAVPCGMKKVLWRTLGGTEWKSIWSEKASGKGGPQRMLRMSAGEEGPGKTPPQKEQGLLEAGEQKTCLEKLRESVLTTGQGLLGEQIAARCILSTS